MGVLDFITGMLALAGTLDLNVGCAALTGLSVDTGDGDLMTPLAVMSTGGLLVAPMQCSFYALSPQIYTVQELYKAVLVKTAHKQCQVPDA